MYDTDLNDAQWAHVARFIPAAKHGGRPRTTSERAALNAILYVVKTGCHWRLLPREFPPWQTVFRYFAEWRRRGVYRKLNAALLSLMRVSERENPLPTIAVIDTQSVKTGKYAGEKTRGFDGGKKVKGRKRVLVTDKLGLLIEAAVVPANMHDTKCAEKVFAKIARKYRALTNSIKVVYADQGFRGSLLAGFVKSQMKARIETSENLTKAGGPFVPAKKRWVVERTFSWLYDCYRLQFDRERTPKNSLAMVRLASIRWMLRRLYAPPT